MLATPFAHTLAAEERRFETLKQKGLLFSSAPEEKFYELLLEKFDNEDVIHHVIVDGYRIDFYIKSIDTYIQFDGVYWHGLNAPYDQLTGTPKIKFDRDRRCDKHFKESGLRLVRITDLELKENEEGALSRV